MISEDDLTALLKRAVRDLDPAVHAIVTGAEQRGRRLRARRRAWRAAGGGCAAVLAVAAVLAGAWLARPAARPLAAPASGHNPGTLAAGAPAPLPSPQAPPPTSPVAASPPPLMPPKQMLATLRRLLPAGSTLGYVNPDTTKPGNLEVDYNDGHGAVDFLLSVGPATAYAPLSCPTPLWADEGKRPAGALPVSCEMRTLPDGSLERDAVYYADSAGFYGYSVYDSRPDGVMVMIQVGNGINHVFPQVDRARPPGSMAEWASIAENPVWQ